MSGRRIRIVDAGDGRLRLKWSIDDYVVFHCVKEDFKRTFSRHSERSYNEASRSWSVPLWCRQRLQQWCDCWFRPEEQCWPEDDEPAGYGHTYSRGRADYGSYPHQRNTSAVEAAYALLCVTPQAPDGLVDVAYRWWSKQLHPDLGGDEARMKAINKAADVIRQDRERKAS